MSGLGHLPDWKLDPARIAAIDWGALPACGLGSCGARAGDVCHDRTGRERTPHKGRLRDAGQAPPRRRRRRADR